VIEVSRRVDPHRQILSESAGCERDHDAEDGRDDHDGRGQGEREVTRTARGEGATHALRSGGGGEDRDDHTEGAHPARMGGFSMATQPR
jgi:hypothetical protein